MKVKLDLPNNKLKEDGSKDSVGISNTEKVKFKLSKNQKFALLSFFLIIAVFFISSFGLDIISRKTFTKFDLNYSLLEYAGIRGVKAAVPEVPQVRDQENPVNGNLVTRDKIAEMKSRKLVVISINNHTEARPQFGLSKADMILEVLAEGGITRYNAYYYENQNVEKIGPIRSARSYMLQYLLGFDDPVFVHEGQASYPPQETPVPETNTLYHLSAWGIKSLQTAASRYRDPERIASAGYVHSLMTSFDLINPEIERLGWVAPSNIEPLSFKFDAEEKDRGDVSKIHIDFTSLSTSAYSSEFNYDKSSNTYPRSAGGQADIDALTNEQIAPKNVIVEYHDYRDAMDGHSRIIIDMIGEGQAYIFRDGKMIEATWKKKDREDRTKYYDKNGNPIE